MALQLNTLLIFLCVSCISNSDSHDRQIVSENDFETISFGSFVESDFPYFSTYLDARKLGKYFPANNVVSRGLVINLGDSSYVCFDRDLLRWSVAWTGERLSKSMLPEVSYTDYFNKKNTIPHIVGEPVLATGMYPGWSFRDVNFNDIRPIDQEREGFKWGPLPTHYGRWNGCYTYEDKVVLSYMLNDVEINELPGIESREHEVFFTRTFRIGGFKDTIFLNVAEILNANGSKIERGTGYIYFGEQRDSVLGIGIKADDSENLPLIRITEERYISVAVPPRSKPQIISIVLWSGLTTKTNLFQTVADEFKTDFPEFERGGISRWPDKVYTKGKLAPDTSAYVTDIVTLPLPNPWKRNVRVTDLTFINESKAAVSTFEGDIWIVDGLKGDLEMMTWQRFASGLYEPMSIEYYDGQIYTFGKEGIVRFHDLNGDGEADYYENFCDLMHQSAESYEWAQDMVISADYGIYISKGGGLTARPGITKELIPGFRAGSNHSGVVMKISLDGKQAEVFSTGFRAPYLGFHQEAGILTVTDQQGNFVPSTPIFLVGKGEFFGVPATSHRNDHPTPKLPLTWIPHRVDRSAASEIWISSDQMGPLNEALVHISFGKPGLFKVLFDSTSQGLQAAVTPIHSEFNTPVSKGALGPQDGQLYLAGFNLLGSSAKGVSAIQRLRYTGIETLLPKEFSVGSQGVIISFNAKIDSSSAVVPSNYQIKRWNYKRTEMYGSGHFKMDGNPGEEILPVLGAYLSEDQNKILLLIPDIKQVDQMEILYNLKTINKEKYKDGIWFSVNYIDDLNITTEGFENVDLNLLQIDENQIHELVKYDPPITRERGRDLFVKQGCAGCHSPGTETDGMYGPPFKGLYESERLMKDGSIIVADNDYLIESILEPNNKIVKGYEAEMPPFRGILTDADIEALLLYIMYLKY